jgi:hypothetical protein
MGPAPARGRGRRLGRLVLGAERTDRLHGGASLAAPLLPQRLRPPGSAERRGEADQQNIEVVQSAEVLLEPAKGHRYDLSRLGVHGAREVGDLPEPADPDAQSMESVHRRSFARLSVGLDQFRTAAGLVVAEETVQPVGPGRPGRRPEEVAYLVEQEGIALRPEERPKELASGPGIVVQSGPIAFEALALVLRARLGFHAAQEIDRYVPVPHLPDELGEATHPSVDRPQRRSVGSLDHPLPDGEPGA